MWPASLFLFLVITAPTACLCNITFVESASDAFEIHLSGIKLFTHNESHPMMFFGQGEVRFEESNGNFQIDDYQNFRMPLPYSIVYSDQVPIDLELYMDLNHYVRILIFADDSHELVVQIDEVESGWGGVDRLWLRMAAHPAEKVFGGGEQFSYFNLRGRSFPMWTREQAIHSEGHKGIHNAGVGRNKSTLTTFYADLEGGAGGDYHTTYFPQPTFLSTRGYYLYHEGADYTQLDFTQPDFHELFILAQHSVTVGRVHFQTGRNMPELLDHLSGYMGRQPPVPDWVHSGAILAVQGGTRKLEGYIRQADDYRVAVTAVWLQDWAGSVSTPSGQRPFWDWQWNQELYPELPSVITELADRGIRVLGYISPYLREDGQLFAVADEHGYFVKNASNQTFLNVLDGFSYGIVDLTNPAAFTWYKDDVIRKNMINFGFGGWMADSGEYLPVRGVFLHSGQSPEEAHNQWPVLWARLNREAVEEAGKLGDIVFWMRAGFSGSGNYSTLMWAGDQNVDWSLSDGLASTITAALSMAMSGVALTHFDIGGFTTFAAFRPPLVRTEELLLRSAEMAVFTPVFRTQEGSDPPANVQYHSSRGTLLKFARLSRLFASLKFYTIYVVNASSTIGLPAQRPLFLNYPSDALSYDVQYQYMYGDDVLVAPVYLPGIQTWDVYLPYDPEASWVFLWDESIVYAGGVTVNVPAPLGQTPVFYRNVSQFADGFRDAVSSEPLVDTPAYVPMSAPTTDGVKPTGTDTNGAGVFMSCSVYIALLALIVMTNLYV